MAEQKKLYALLIGINDYAEEKHRLKGCINDVNRMEKYLKGLPDYSVNIHKITGENGDPLPTKKEITESFKTFFSAAKSGDISLFYFSGHGVQEAAPDWATDEADESLECLVCWDKDQDQFLLADKELRYLFQKTFGGKKIHLVSIFDCCHSGDNTREYAVTRSMNESDDSAALKVKKFSSPFPERYWEEFIFCEDYSTDQLISQGIDHLFPIYPHIHISACRSRESAHEKNDQGVFTKYLLDTLENTDSRLNYLDIKQYARFYFYDHQKPQIPDIKVYGNHATIYSNWLNQDLVLDAIDAIQMSYDKKVGWTINAGAMQGVDTENQVQVTPEDDTTFELKIQKVEASRSILEQDLDKESHLDKNKPFYLVQTKTRLPGDIELALIDLDCNLKLADHIREYFETSVFELTVDPAGANYHLVIFNDLVYICNPFAYYQPLAKQIPVLIGDSIDWPILTDQLKKINKARKFRKLHNPQTFYFKTPPIKIEVKVSQESDWVEIGNNDFSVTGNIHQPTLLDFRFTNNTTDHLYLSALVLSGDFEILDQTFFAESSIKIKPHQVLTASRQSFQMLPHIPVYNIPYDETFFKLIVSTRDINTSQWIQSAVELPYWQNNPDVYDNLKAFGSKYKLPEKEDWTTIDFRIIQENPQLDSMQIAREFLDDEVIGPFIHHNFFEFDTDGRFIPKITRKNEALHEGEKGLWFDLKLKLGNALRRNQRKRRFNRLIKLNKNQPIYLSEGDSWFQHPLLYDIIDYLMNEFVIRSIGAGGDTIRNMLKQGEIHHYIRSLQDEGYNLRAVLISGGGNDILGEELAQFLNDSDTVGNTNDPSDYLSQTLFDEISKIQLLYETLIQRYPKLHFISHGYDYAIPYQNGSKKGWIGKYLDQKKIFNNDDREGIIKVLIETFNRQMKELEKHNNFTFIDNLGTVRRNQWDDEIHPNNQGFQDISQKFIQTINNLKPLP